MAEPFGIVAGAVGIAATFTACVDCFSYVQHGRHFGWDYQTELMSVECARLRLACWGQAVNIYKDPNLGRPDASPSEVQAAKNALHQILVLFEDTQKMSRAYRQDSKPGDDLTLRKDTKELLNYLVLLSTQVHMLL